MASAGTGSPGTLLSSTQQAVREAVDKAVEAHRRRNSMVGALSLGQSRTQVATSYTSAASYQPAAAYQPAASYQPWAAHSTPRQQCRSSPSLHLGGSVSFCPALLSPPATARSVPNREASPRPAWTSAPVQRLTSAPVQWCASSSAPQLFTACDAAQPRPAPAAQVSVAQAPHQSAAPEALPPAADALGPETSRGKPRRRRIAVPVSVVAEPVAEVQAPGGQAQECAQPPAAGSPSAPGAPLPRFEPPLWEGPLPVPETPLPETPLPTPAPAASPEPECSPAGAGRVFGVWPQSHDQCAIEDVSNLSTAVDDGDCSKLDSEGTTGLASCKSACSSTSSSGLSSSCASGSSDAFGGDGNVASHGRLGSDAASGLRWSACPVPALRLELPGAAPASPDEVGVASPAASLCLSPDSVSGAPSCVAEAEGENLFNWSTELQQGAAETIEGAQCQGEAMRSWLSSLECIAMEDEAGLGPGALPELARPPLSTLSQNSLFLAPLSTLSQNSLFLESPFQLQPTPKSARGPSPLARGRTPMTPGFELISPLFAVPQASPAPSAATAAPESPDVFGSAVSYVVVYAPSAVELSPPKACLHMSWRQVSGDLENTLPA